jgi:uncharacterized repeat protein (TIGR01451 family)
MIRHRVLAGVLLLAMAPAAFAVLFPTTANVSFQTSGRERAPTIGDWYTTRTSASTDRLHRIEVEITATQLAACGGSCTITIGDADSTAGPGPYDEVLNAGDPTRFQLRAADGVTVLQSTTVASGAPNGTNVLFSVNAVGRYQITSETGAFPISGNATVGLNDDDNSFTVDVPFAGGTGGGLVGDIQTSWQQNSGGSLTFPLYFFVGPSTANTTLQLRNFDLDTGATSVVYQRPGGANVTGTLSGNGVWNNGGSLNAGADTVVANTALPGAAPDAGLWRFTLNNWTNNNQAVFEANGGVRFTMYETLPQRAGNFSMAPAATLSTNPGTAVDHPFTITNHFNTTDIINLTLSGTGANWSAQLLTGAGAALTDTDGNGQVDSGIMNPNETRNFILRVTPNAGAIGPSTTTVSGVSFMDLRVVPAINTTVSMAKTTYLRVQIAKAFSAATITAGATATLTFTLTNANSAALTGLAFTDTYPVGLTNASPLAVGGSCAGVTHTAAAGGATFNVTGGSVPAAAGAVPGSCTVTVAVTSATAGTHANTASGASGTVSGNSIVAGAASNTATLTVLVPLTVVKAAQTYSDPFNGTTNPKAIPGAFVNYTVSVTNSNATTLDNDSVVIVDAVPPNTALFVGNFGGAGSGPVSFVNGAPSSGLTYTFTSLASAADDVSFSNNGGVSFAYTPVPDANGVDAAVTHIRLNPKGTMNAAGIGNPNFSVVFRVRID